MSLEVERALTAAHRDEWGLVVGATMRAVRDLGLAEESVQEAYADALRQWPETGVPANPAAWLTTAARRRAVDAVRREGILRSKLPLLVETDPQPTQAEAADPDERQGAGAEAPVRDERLRLLLLCCHPALPPEGRTALTLRLVCGVGTSDIARIFLVPERTMAARITRAKRKIAGSGISFRLPSESELPERLRYVFDVVHLLFTVGHTAPSGDDLIRPDLIDESVRLGHLLATLLPSDPEVKGLVALMLATDARRATRTGPDGRPVDWAKQDRAQWDRGAAARARALLMSALPAPGAGRYTLQAAIAVLHAESPSFAETDWPQVLGLYDRLLEIWPSPVVRLNRAVVLAQVDSVSAGLREVDCFVAEGRLDGYPYLDAVRADLLARVGRASDAAEAYRRAALLTDNAAEERLLLSRLTDIG